MDLLQDEAATDMSYFLLSCEGHEPSKLEVKQVKKEVTSQAYQANNDRIIDVEESQGSFWEDRNIFSKSVNNGFHRFDFYDGPPFATGTPHYGHILVAAIKDFVARYVTTAKGRSVPRIAGWDCRTSN